VAFERVVLCDVHYEVVKREFAWRRKNVGLWSSGGSSVGDVSGRQGKRL
jgi:hypothetical protein